jgi:hypothetical protein
MSKKRKLSRGSRAGHKKTIEQSRKRRIPRVLPFNQSSQQRDLDDTALNNVETLKFTYAMWVQNHPIGGRQMARLENTLKAGRFAFLPEESVEHWGMEEYLWHGMPDHDWNPIEAFLVARGQGFSETGWKQFRRWQEMKIGFYEIGRVDRTAEMWVWDHLTETRLGDSFQVVSCGIGGVDFLRQYVGELLLTYLSPWQPDQNIFCTGGYGPIVQKDDLKGQELLLGLSRPDILVEPLEFGFGPGNRPTRKLREVWKQRDWLGWLKGRLNFPFRALVTIPATNSLHPVQITSIQEMTADEARRKGIYFHTAKKVDNFGIFGGTTVTVADVISPNFLPLLEYHAYREWAGPPPEAPKSSLPLVRNFRKIPGRGNVKL